MKATGLAADENAEPTAWIFVPEPPRATCPEQRIRAALGLPRGVLPAASNHWLRKYYAYLATRLVLPFEAEYVEEAAHFRQLSHRVTVVAVLDPSQRPDSEDAGLICTILKGTEAAEAPLIELEVEEGHPNFQLIEDYWYWVWNWRFDPQI